jgi:uncharacterized RDD family membrane protein YckC
MTGSAPFTAKQKPQVVSRPQNEPNPIVQAALTRVRRATENASRAALPKIEPARPMNKSSLALDREATARALEAPPEITTRTTVYAPTIPEVEEAPARTPAIDREDEAAPVATTCSEADVEKPVAEQAILPALEAVEAVDIQPIDEIEPLDYLEAEIRKVDRSLGLAFDRNESPTIGAHIAIGIIDLLSIAVSCSPFLGFLVISNGSLSEPQTRFAATMIFALVAFFYLAITHCLCGKTFGMMLTNTRVVDALTFEPLPPSRALLRAAGYFVAAAPALAGFVWAAFNRRHRGWHDYISGAQVSRDF